MSRKPRHPPSGPDDAQKVIQGKLAEARSLIKECEALADEHSLTFSWDLAYGMGGHYQGAPTTASKYGDDEHGWQSSSSGC